MGHRKGKKQRSFSGGKDLWIYRQQQAPTLPIFASCASTHRPLSLLFTLPTHSTLGLPHHNHPTMGFFNKIKEQAFERAKEEMMQQMGLDLDAIAGMAGGGGAKKGKMTQDEYEATKPDEMRKDVRMISGCEDHQTSADVSNVAAFQLPDPAGRVLCLCV
jgi:hypothetical protein